MEFFLVIDIYFYVYSGWNWLRNGLKPKENFKSNTRQLFFYYKPHCQPVKNFWLGSEFWPNALFGQKYTPKSENLKGNFHEGLKIKKSLKYLRNIVTTVVIKALKIEKTVSLSFFKYTGFFFFLFSPSLKFHISP